MANTLSTNLIVDIAVETAITTIGPMLAPLGSFITDFSDEAVAASNGGSLQPIQVSLATGTSAVVTNPITFETGDTTIGAAQITPARYYKRFGLTAAEQQSGHRLARMFEINLRTLAKKLIDVALTPVTEATFGTAIVAKTAANFTSADVKTLRGAIADGSSKVLILDGDYYAKLLPTSLDDIPVDQRRGAGFAGFDNIFENTRWTGAGTDIVGFAASPEALAMAARLPVIDPAVQNQMFTAPTAITIPGLGLTIYFYMWGSLLTQSVNVAYDVVFGCAAADTTALKIVKTA